MNSENGLMISFSGGRSSAYMTDRVLQESKSEDIIVCFANTGKEEPETLDFVHKCDKLWNGIVHWLEYDPVSKFKKVTYDTASRHGEPFAAVIDKRGYVPNVVWRFCTQDLKIRVIKWFMLGLGYKHWVNAVGIRYDEPSRWAKTRAIAEKERWDTWLPLVDWRVTKPMVLDYWKGMSFDLHLKHYQGNCDLCFLKGRNKIKRLLTETPKKANWWMDQELKVGGTFRNGYSMKMFLDFIIQNPTLFDYEEPDFECFCNGD